MASLAHPPIPAVRLARRAAGSIYLRPRPSPKLQQQQQKQQRTFISFPSPPPQTLTSRLTVPYHHYRLYDLIADVDSYHTFLPYCSVSRVTAWTAKPVTLPPDDESESKPPSSNNDPDPDRRRPPRRWPTRADLTAGWGGFEETYTSTLTCVPHRIVEAISGPDARSEVPLAELRRLGLSPQPPHHSSHHHHHHQNGGSGSSGVFKSLVTRWTVAPAGRPHHHPSLTDSTTTAATRGNGNGSGNGDAEGRSDTDTDGDCDWSTVQLDIRFQFANPLYAAVSSAVADRVAPLMVQAFSERADRVLGREDAEERRRRRQR